MPDFNEMFELSIEDIDLIEVALRRTSVSLSLPEAGESDQARSERESMARRIHELLGRLHDQKIFYRPKDGVYVGG